MKGIISWVGRCIARTSDRLCWIRDTIKTKHEERLYDPLYLLPPALYKQRFQTCVDSTSLRERGEITLHTIPSLGMQRTEAKNTGYPGYSRVRPRFCRGALRSDNRDGQLDREHKTARARNRIEAHARPNEYALTAIDTGRSHSMSAELYERQVLWREFIHRRVSARVPGLRSTTLMFGCTAISTPLQWQRGRTSAGCMELMQLCRSAERERR